MPGEEMPQLAKLLFTCKAGREQYYNSHAYCLSLSVTGSVDVLSHSEEMSLTHTKAKAQKRHVW